jgi:hypothetical protein
MDIRAEYSFKDAGTNAVLTVKNGNLLMPKQEIEIKNMQ